MMKIGATYLVTILKYGYPPKMEDELKGFEYLQKLGFHYLEMEGLGREHAERLMANLPIYKAALKDNGLHIHNFCGVDPDLVSLDDTKRKAAYEHFKKIAEVGCELGAETLHLASYTPPVEYLGRAPYKLDGGDYEFGSKTRLRIPDGFDWERVWEVLVESCRFCADTAQSLGRVIIMEPRVDEIICSVDSMRRLIDDVDSPYFKANFDTGHFNAQRENCCLALEKLKGRYANIHIADNDPVNTDHVTVGDGTIDWHEFFRILVKQGYDGYLGLDLGAKDDKELEEKLLVSRERLMAIARSEGAEITY